MHDHGFRARLTALIDQAKERAVANGGRVLVSVSERITIDDPLHSIESLYRAIRSEMQLADHITAAYWARPSQGFAIAAFGAAAVLSPTGAERFGEVDMEWQLLLRDSLVETDSPLPRGVGPVLIGGFAFEHDGPHTQKWSGFPAARMTIPQVHVTSWNGESWVTVSAVSPDKQELDNLAILGDRLRLSFPVDRLGTTDNRLAAVTADIAPDRWKTLVRDAVDRIRTDELRKVVLARSVHGTSRYEIDPFKAVRILSDNHPDALVFGFWNGDKVFVGASPEKLANVEDGEVTASSLAGTVRRGSSSEEDARLAQELESSEKDLVEHAAVRDMLHEIISEVADDVIAPTRPEVLTLSNVHHLHTEVRGALRNGHSLLDVVARLHPTPAVGGTPRDAALEFIRTNENLDRGWYAAPVGWVDRNGGEFAVALRSGLIDSDGFTLYAGCGIVADSDPEDEFCESELKLEPMRIAMACAHREIGLAAAGELRENR